MEIMSVTRCGIHSHQISTQLNIHGTILSFVIIPQDGLRKIVVVVVHPLQLHRGGECITRSCSGGSWCPNQGRVQTQGLGWHWQTLKSDLQSKVPVIYPKV